MILEQLEKCYFESAEQGYELVRFELGQNVIEQMIVEFEQMINFKIDRNKELKYRDIPIIKHEYNKAFMFVLKLNKILL